MNPSINISFRYTEGDCVRALRAHYASLFRLPLDIAATFVLAGIGSYLLSFSTLQWLGVSLIGIAALFGIMLLGAFVVIPRLAFRREPKFRDDYSLVFSAEGIHFHTLHVDSQIQWGLYSSAMIDAYSYILYYSAREMTVIPKRVFQSAEQQREFELLLTQRIPQIVRRNP